MLDLEAVDAQIDIPELAKVHRKAVNKAQFSKRHSQAEIFWSAFSSFLEERLEALCPNPNSAKAQALIEGDQNAADN